MSTKVGLDRSATRRLQGVEAVPTGAINGGKGLDRVWSLPNVISFARIVLVGVFCWLLFGPDTANPGDARVDVRRRHRLPGRLSCTKV